ncbi:MAG: hypothetical protein UV73_C0014G0024 [Candidatus Gottesmanbacteria bacterium GW2011_GWA2_43_14]|uniref:YdjC family protein n=1 Tax=Candidatus Gottesmanbacteria bacterium GW2011_GWA2_43_14 TaxID=1618443 RepID=A0A0G1DDR4_9BACT|nr:MAG: hypothetical protein UV73_C0014G0024 [Candidatus Gottesmanbacteria bacterium GW2011_GWA2_43_14]
MTHEKVLIVNADDYGLTPNISRGIRESYNNGIVRSTSAMMNIKGVADELNKLLAESPGLGIGVHLNLTVGAPFLPGKEVSTLVDQDGFFPKNAIIYQALPEMDPDQIHREWRTQIEAMFDLGIKPDHLDSHHFVSYKSGILQTIMLQLATEFELPIRNVPEKPGMLTFPSVLAVKTPDRTETGFFGDGVSQNLILEILSGLGIGTTELMTHPGFVDEDLLKLSKYNRQRHTELEILCSQAVKDQIDHLGIKLSNFSQL